MPEDSINTHRLLQEFGIETQLKVIPDAEHTMRWTKTKEGNEWSVRPIYMSNHHAFPFANALQKVPDLEEKLDALFGFVSNVLERK